MPNARSPIRVLASDVAARIAAGEVIERPASVVKELVENALDAGARSIRIDVQGGGLELIRVGDDGCGIPAADLWLACQRHATSKLAGDDLSQVRTLGFRGEALPSIAAVAELSLVSAADESGVGRRLTLRGSEVIRDEPAPRPRGTTVSVRQLYQTVPVRLAAVARIQTEHAQIGQVVRRLALTAPDVRFALFVDHRLVVQTTGVGELATTLTEVYGQQVAASVHKVGPMTVAGATIAGVICGGEVTRPGRGQLNLIVNGRWVQPRGLVQLIETAYRPLLPRGRHPVLAIRIETAPDQLDVNIHPRKLEVRLLAERLIGQEIGDLVRQVLGRRPLPLVLTGATLELDPIKQTDAAAIAETGPVWDEAPIETPNLPPLRLLGQLQNRLLLLEGEGGLFLIDQHRAHERMLYERLTARHEATGPEPVALPEPLLLELSPAQLRRFDRQLEHLATLGFQCEAFGGRAFLVRAAPALPGLLAPGGEPLAAGLSEPGVLVPALLELADEEAAEGEEWHERLLVRLACRTAVRRGRSLSRSAMRALVEGLGSSPTPAVCPHGSPLLMHVSETALAKQFDWS